MRSDHGALELHVDVREGVVRGCMLLHIECVPKATFRCSAGIEIEAVAVNGVKAFWSRTAISDVDGNLHVFLPDEKKAGLWSPVPDCQNLDQMADVVITWKIRKKSPSLVKFPGVLGVTNVPYGIGGWMPEPLIPQTSLDTILIKTDKTDHVVLGPCPGSRRQDGMWEFQLSNIGNLRFVGWIVGNLKETIVSGFRFLSIGQVDLSRFAFLSEIAPLAPGADAKPFVMLPRHPCEMELTCGFAVLSTELMLDYCDFPSIIPIPWQYQIVYAVGYALAFMRFGKDYSCNCGVNWFVSGVMSYAAKPYMVSAIGETAYDVFQWVMLRYCFSYTGEKTLDGSEMELLPHVWNSQNPMRIKAWFVVQILVNMVSDEFQDPWQFPSLWTCNHLDRAELQNLLRRYFKDPTPFIDFFVRGSSYLVMGLSYAAETTRDLRSLYYVTMHLAPLEKVSKSSRPHLPVTMRVFHEMGSLAETVELVAYEELYSEFSFPRSRRRNKKSQKDPVSVSGILFCVVETNPRMPIIVLTDGVRDCPHIASINLIKCYSASPFAQHEALSSLQKILLRHGDTGAGEILSFLQQLLDDPSVFFSLKCHAIHILSEVSNHNVFPEMQEKAKEVLLRFFFENIVHEESMLLKKAEGIPTEIVVSIFRAISSMSKITETFSSFDYLRSAVTQIASLDIGPAIILCFLGVPLDNFRHVRQLQVLTIENMQAMSNNVPLITASVHVFNRMVDSIDSEVVTERVMVSMLESFLDRKIPTRARLAIAQLLIDKFPIETFLNMQNGLRAEMEADDPDYNFIRQVLIQMQNSERIEHDNVRQGRREIHTVMHEILQLATDTDEALYQVVKDLFVSLFEEWPYKQTPDGLIRAQRLDFENRNVTVGLDSASD